MSLSTKAERAGLLAALLDGNYIAPTATRDDPRRCVYTERRLIVRRVARYLFEDCRKLGLIEGSHGAGWRITEAGCKALDARPRRKKKEVVRMRGSEPAALALMVALVLFLSGCGVADRVGATIGGRPIRHDMGGGIVCFESQQGSLSCVVVR